MLTPTSPRKTYAHALPAGAKVAGFVAFTTALFILPTPWLAAPLIAALILAAGRDFTVESLHNLRPLIPLLILLALWHLALRDPNGIALITRMVLGVAAANFVTMTSTLTDLTRLVESAARPLRRLIAPKTLALAFGLTLRFIPAMLQRSDQIRQSWRARSAKNPGWRTILPLTLAALDDATHTAEALRARGGL